MLVTAILSIRNIYITVFNSNNFSVHYFIMRRLQAYGSCREAVSGPMIVEWWGGVTPVAAVLTIGALHEGPPVDVN